MNPNKPFIIGIIGHAKSGKDTFVDTVFNNEKLLACQAEAYGSIALAAGLKKMAMILGFSEKECYDQEYKEQINSLHGITPRKAMQDIGTIFREKFGKDIWLKCFEHTAVREFGKNSIVFVPDIRFPNEANYIRKRFSCIMVKIIRPGLDLSLPMYQHESETLIDDISLNNSDIIIKNDGTLEDFKNKCNESIDTIVRQYKRYRSNV